MILCMRWLWAWVGVASAALALVWWHSGETTAATLAAVVAAGLVATGPLAGWLSARAGTTSNAINDQLERLATVVRAQWEEEAGVRQLSDPQPIVVRWTAADPGLMDHPEVIAPERAARSASRINVAAPAAPSLALSPWGMLERRTPEDPVPVLLSVASWTSGSGR